MRRNWQPEYFCSIKIIKFEVKIFSKKISGPDSFTVDFYETFKEEIITTLDKVYHKIKLHEVNIITAYKPETYKKEILYMTTSHGHINIMGGIGNILSEIAKHD